MRMEKVILIPIISKSAQTICQPLRKKLLALSDWDQVSLSSQPAFASQHAP